MAKIYTLATALLTFALASHAAIPVRWTTDAYKVKPLVYDCYHGETLDMAAALTAYGEPLDFAGKTAKLYWQTNGMASAWWSTNAFVRTEAGATNILSAIWSGAYDTGAASVTGFIGVEGENYRAAFTLNFRPSPGFVPNQMPIPPKTIDWATVANSNVDSAPFALKGSGLTPEQAKVIAANQVTNDVAPWAMAGKSEPQGMTTNAVEDISDNRITNSVLAGYLCTVEAASGMTNNISFAQLKNKPTTLSGYGITDAYTKTETDGKFLYKNYSSLIFNNDDKMIGEYSSAEIRHNSPGDSIEFGSNPMFPGIGMFSYKFFINSIGESGYSMLTPDGSDVLTKNLGDDYYLGKTAQAADSAKLNGHTEAQVVAGLINAPTATNIADAVVGVVMEYGLTNVTGTAITLVSGEIGNATITANTSVTLDFSADANKSGDCMLYAINATATDYTISPQPTEQYTFVSADLAKALTIGKATTNVLSFTRLNANTVLVGKLEVK